MIDTQIIENFENILGDVTYSQLKSKQLLGIGQPDDVANAAAFLVSGESRFMTGRYLYLDGGRLS